MDQDVNALIEFAQAGSGDGDSLRAHIEAGTAPTDEELGRHGVVSEQGIVEQLDQLQDHCVRRDLGVQVA